MSTVTTREPVSVRRFWMNAMRSSSTSSSKSSGASEVSATAGAGGVWPKPGGAAKTASTADRIRARGRNL